MNTFKIKYYYQSTFKNGSANDWDNIKSDEFDLDLPDNATQTQICELWQKTNRLERVAFVSAELVEIDYGNCKSCDKKLEYLGALLWDNSGYVCNDCDMKMMVIPNLDNYYNNDI